MDGWNTTFLSYWVPGSLFSGGRFVVSFREGNIGWTGGSYFPMVHQNEEEEYRGFSCLKAGLPDILVVERTTKLLNKLFFPIKITRVFRKGSRFFSSTIRTRYIHIHQKLNRTESQSQRTPDQVNCDRAILDTQG